MDNEKVKEELSKKNGEIKELMERISEYSESEKYIENLTDQIIGKDSNITDMQLKVNELKEKLALTEEMVEELEEFNNIMGEEADAHEDEIETLRLSVARLEEQGKTDLKNLQKYRDKMQNVQGEIEIIRA